MKALFFIPLFLLTVDLSLGQDLLEFSQVVEVPGVSKDALFDRGFLWALDLPEGEILDLRFSLEFSDPAMGLLIFNGSYPYSLDESIIGKARIDGSITYKLEVYIRDGRYKYIVSDIYHQGSPGMGGLPLSYGYLYDSDEPIMVDLFDGKPKKAVWDDLKDAANSIASKHIKAIQGLMVTPTELETDW